MDNKFKIISIDVEICLYLIFTRYESGIMKHLNRIVFCIVLFLAILHSGFAELVMIGNSTLKGKSVTKSDAKAIYQLSKKKIGDLGIVFIDARIHNRGDLLNYLGTTDKELSNLWLKARLTGSSNPPKPLSEEEAVKSVVSTPNAIAIVNKDKVLGDAIILLIIK